MKRKDLLLLIGVIILAVLGAAAMFFGGASESLPISAESMTEEERAEIDVAVLAEELADFDIESISVNYSSDIISVRINKKTSEQYVDDYASDVVSAIKTALTIRKSDMTLEKDRYNVTIRGTDGLIKIAST